MSYATVADVEALNSARTYTATSAPNLDDVGRYLTETSAVLDGILNSRGFTLPVPTTATSALELLAHYNSVGAWALVEAAAKTSPSKDTAAKAWAAAQKMLSDGLIEPVGLTRDQGTTRPRASFNPTAMFRTCMEL